MNEKLLGVTKKLVERKRDALVATCRGPAYQAQNAGSFLPTIDNLDAYFLMDTQVSSEVMTTVVSDVITSLQLYINNIVYCIEPGYSTIEWEILNAPPEDILEEEKQDDDTPDSDEDRALKYVYAKTEWVNVNCEYDSWRANRLMAEYPGNYLSASLRPNKTAAFDALSAALTKQDLNEENVTAAVKSYLNDFEEVANLNIVSAYLGSFTNNYTGKLHLLGCTPTTPVTYYYRTCDLCSVDADGYPVASAWTGWQRVSSITNNGTIIGRPRVALQNDRVYVAWFERIISGQGDITVQVTGSASTPASTDVTITGYVTYQKYDGSWSSAQTVATHTESVAEQPSVNYPLYATATDSDAYFNTTAFEYQPEGGNPFLFCAIYTKSVATLEKEPNSPLIKDMVLAGYVNALMNSSAEPQAHLFEEALRTYLTNSSQPEGQQQVQVMLEGPQINVDLEAEIYDDTDVTDPEPTIFVGQELPTIVAQNDENKTQPNVLVLTSGAGGSNTYSLTFKPGFTSPSYAGDQVWSFSVPGTSGSPVITGTYSIDTRTWTGTLEYEVLPGAPFKQGVREGVSDAGELPLLWFLPSQFDSGRTPNLVTKNVVSVSADGRTVKVNLIHGPRGGDVKYGTAPPTTDEIGKVQFGEFMLRIQSTDAWTPTNTNTGKATRDVNVHTPGWNNYTSNDGTTSYYNDQCTATQVPTAVQYYLVASDDDGTTISHSSQQALDSIDTDTTLVITDAAYTNHGEKLRVGIITVDKTTGSINHPKGQTWKRAYFKEKAPIDLAKLTLPVVRSYAQDIASYTALYLDASKNNYPCKGPTTAYPLIRLNTTFVPALIAQASLGLQYLYTWDTQLTPEPPLVSGEQPSPMDFRGANGLYFWELFLHVPMLVAETYCAQGNYLAALVWYSRVFDPRSRNQKSLNTQPIPDYWKTVPIAPEIGDETPPPAVPYYPLNKVIPGAPNVPYATAYDDPYYFRQYVYMSFVRALIGAGDTYYRQLTFDSVNRAMQIYSWAYDLLGARPTAEISSFAQGMSLANAAAPQSSSQSDEQAAVLPANWPIYPASAYLSMRAGTATSTPRYELFLPFLPTENARLSALWDTIDARRFNIRHNLDITGRPIAKPLYLVSDDGGLPQRRGFKPGTVWGADADREILLPPPYRYGVMVGLARNAVNTLMGFGQQLLGYMGGVDSRTQAIKQQTYLADLRKLTMDNADAAVAIAQGGRATLCANLTMAENRRDHYKKLYDDNLSGCEVTACALRGAAQGALTLAAIGFGIAGGMKLTPNIFGTSAGGARLEGIAEGNAYWGVMGAIGLNIAAGDAQIAAGYERRRNEWLFQCEQSEDEINSLNKQILVQDLVIGAAITSRCLTKKQCDDIDDMLDYLSNSQLTGLGMYNWLNNTMSGLYNIAYTQALALCQQAQTCWQYELVADDDFFGTFSNSMETAHYGMLSGEQLLNALNKMDAEWYSTRNARKLEITKTYSLRNDIGDTLFKGMVPNGVFTFTVNPESDYQGLYMHQITSVTITLPAAVGPYQNIRATLQQTSSAMKRSPGSSATNTHTGEKVALSFGVNDSGLFSLSLDDPKYLPFEGTGANSSWTLTFEDPTTSQQNVLNSLDDVIMTMCYTARPTSS